MLPKPRHILAVIAIIIGAIATFHTGFSDALRLAIILAGFSVLVLVFSASFIDEIDTLAIDWNKPLDETL